MRAFEDYLDLAIAEIESGVATDRKSVQALVEDALALVEGSEAMAATALDIIASAQAVESARADSHDKGKLPAAQTHAIDLIEYLRLLMRAAGPSERAAELGLD